MIATAAKDFNSNFILYNNDFRELFDISTSCKITGVHERALIDTIFDDGDNNTDTVFSEIREEDEFVFRSNVLFSLHAWVIEQKIKYVLAAKSPYHCPKGKIIGAIFNQTEIINPSKDVIQNYINNPNIRVSEHSLSVIDRYQSIKANNDYGLSARELACLEKIIEGYSAKEISSIYGISKRTVESHINNIKRKLKVTKLNQLIVKVIQENIINI